MERRSEPPPRLTDVWSGPMEVERSVRGSFRLTEAGKPPNSGWTLGTSRAAPETEVLTLPLTFSLESSVERFQEGIVSRLARAREVDLHSRLATHAQPGAQPLLSCPCERIDRSLAWILAALRRPAWKAHSMPPSCSVLRCPHTRSSHFTALSRI